MVTELESYADETAEQVDDPVAFECLLHDPDEKAYVMVVSCGGQTDLAAAVDRAVESSGLDLGFSDWKPI